MDGGPQPRPDKATGSTGNKGNLRDPKLYYTPEERKARSSKAGSTPSAKKKLAARLRWLRRKGMTDETAQKLYLMMTERDILSLDILETLMQLKTQLGDVDEHVRWVNAMINFHKMHFGDIKKLNISNNLKINITGDFTSEEKKILLANNIEVYGEDIIDAEIIESATEEEDNEFETDP